MSTPLPRPIATPVRSSMKGKGLNAASQGKRSVSFLPDLVLSRTPSVISSALSRSFGPVEKQWKSKPLETTQTLTEDDDPNDKNYTTTDEEDDEFKNEPYEIETSPELEDESEDNYSEQRIKEGSEDEYYENNDEGEYNWEYDYGEDYEDAHLVEQGKSTIRKRGFEPFHDLQRTPALATSVSSSNSTTARPRRVDSDPVTILRRNNFVAAQREYGAHEPEPQSLPQNPPPRRTLGKNKIKISDYGSPQLQNTPDDQLRRQMEERDTPSGPAGSGFSSALQNPEAFSRVRRNLNSEYFDELARTSNGLLPSFPSSRPVSPKLNPLKNFKFNIIALFFVLLGVFTTMDGSERGQISDLPKSLSYAVKNPKRIIPGISARLISLPQSIICSAITCELTSNNRLKTIAMIATDTMTDLTALSQFADLITALGKPLILSSIGNDLAAEANDRSAEHRDSVAIQAMLDLARDYQNAHLDLRLVVGGSKNLIRLTTKKWVDFSGLLTDQIPRETREEIDLPTGWAKNVPASRRKYSGKALKIYYKACRKDMVSLYQYLYSAMERSEKSINAMLEQTQKVHDAGTYDSTSLLKIIKPLAESVGEVRQNVAFQMKLFGSSDEVFGEPIDEDFTFGILKWKVESLWASVTILQDAALGKVTKARSGRDKMR